MHCLRNIEPALVLESLTGLNRKEVLLELTSAIQRIHPGLDADLLFEILHEREQLGSTAIADGIAIPHGKVRGLEQLVVCFGRSIQGVPFEARDSRPTFLFAVLLAPESAAEEYLACLADLAVFLKGTATKTRLLQAKDREALLGILHGGS